MYEKSISFLPFIVVGLAIALLSWIGAEFDLHEEAENVMYIGLAISETAGMFMLYRCGSFIKTMASKFVYLALGISAVGALFTIMHWPYGRMILISGILIIPVIYIIHFIQKPLKLRLDYLKLAWVLLAFGAVVIRFQHLWSGDIQVLSSAIMWLCIIDFLKTNKILTQMLKRQ